MIYSQCEIIKNLNFEIEQAEVKRERNVTEIQNIFQNTISDADKKCNEQIHALFTNGRERKIEQWHHIKLNLSKLMFNSTLVDSCKSIIVGDIHKWLNNSCQGDVYLFEYSPQTEEDQPIRSSYLNSTSNNVKGRAGTAVEKYPDANNIVVYFENASDAMNFKLTWC
jgi:hypothetical protein